MQWRREDGVGGAKQKKSWIETRFRRAPEFHDGFDGREDPVSSPAASFDSSSHFGKFREDQ